MLRLRLQSLLRSLTRPLRGPRFDKLVRAAPWVVAFAGLEVLGRLSPTDVVDGIGVVLLAALVVLLSGTFDAETTKLWGRVKKASAGWRVNIGLDLRRTPPVPHRLPRRYLLVFLGAIPLVLGLTLARGIFPGAARIALQSVSGLLGLTALGLLWAALLVGFVLCAVAPVVVAEEALAGPAFAPMRRRNLWRVILAGLLVSSGLGFLFLPPFAAPAIVLGVLCLYTPIVFLTSSDLVFLWAPRHAFAVASALRASWVGVASTTWGGLVAFALTLLAAGDRLDGPGDPRTQLTAFLGLAFAWCVAASYVLGCTLAAVNLLRSRWHDPARPRAPLVHVAGCEPRRRGDVRRALATAGLRASFEDLRARTEVPLVVDPAAAPGFHAHAFGWPRRVALADIDDPTLHESCRRRADLLARRALRRGLERLLGSVKARSYENGAGYWIAPHLWFITHLSRDVDEKEGPGSLGAPYARALDPAARRYAHTLFHDVEIDMVFLQDGVSIRRLRRVLAMLFEFHDLFGRRPLEERHFSGIPGVRVLIHELELGGTLGAKGYPEPDYAELGRARILHVFVDQGGEWERTHEPDDAGRRPAPHLVPSA